MGDAQPVYRRTHQRYDHPGPGAYDADPDLAQRYLESCEIALQRCQQRLDSDGPGSAGDANIMESPESEAPIGPLSTLEQHLQRILGHLNTMHTISSVAWRQRPHHGIWLRKISR